MRAGHVSPYRTVQARAGVDSVVLRLSVKAVLRIWILIHRIDVFLGLLDPDPDPLVRGMDPDPGRLSLSKIVRKALISTVL